MKLTPADLEVLIDVFEREQWSELRIRTDDWQLLLSTDTSVELTGVRRTAPLETAQPAQDARTSATPFRFSAPPDAGVVAVQAPPGTVDTPAHWTAVKAPNLGTFYRSAKPGMPPLVNVGQQVDPSTELCLIEVMKLFTTLLAGVRGVVRRICVLDATMVEHGDVLFYIEPS